MGWHAEGSEVHLRLMAPSSILPICPTEKMLATLMEYWSKNVTTRLLEYTAMVFASRCHVVLIWPAETAASQCSASSPLATCASWPYPFALLSSEVVSLMLVTLESGAKSSSSGTLVEKSFL